MTASKRSKVDIYSAILEYTCREGGKLGRASPTRVARRANIPYDRFQKIMDHFINLEMVNKTDKGLLITGKGLRCLKEMKKSNEFLKGMGLEI